MKNIIITTQNAEVKSAVDAIKEDIAQLTDQGYKCEEKLNDLQQGTAELSDFYAHLETALSEFEVATNKELHKLHKHILWLRIGLCAAGLILTLLGIFTISQLI